MPKRALGSAAAALVFAAVCLLLALPSAQAAEGRSPLKNEMPLQDRPDPEELSPGELELVLATWDEAVASGDLRAISDALRLVSWGVPRGYGLRGAHVLRYSNAEIKERVVDLYLDEIQRRGLLPGAPSSAEAGIVHAPGEGESYLDYLDRLVPLAEYTFDPRIYDVVLRNSWGGSSDTYLATVDPERTLALLLQCRIRERRSLHSSPDVLDHPDGLACFSSVKQGFQLLERLCERSPDVVLAERERVLDFVQRYATHYETPVQMFYKEEPSYSAPLDYRTRRLALSVLEVIAGADEIYTIQDIMHDAPLYPASGAVPSEQIAAIGQRLIDRIEQMK